MRLRRPSTDFLILLMAAFILSWIPFLSWPFSWAETFFHEISHGFAAMLLGGKILEIELNINGSGLCTTQGGWRFLTAFSGYAGAALWGTFIYLSASALGKNYAFVIAGLILFLTSLSLLFWTADIITVIILILISVPFILLFFLKNAAFEQFLLKLSGLYILLSAIQSPSYLFYVDAQGDSATLQNLTGVPETIWIVTWFLIAIACLLLIISVDRKATR